MLVSGGPPRSSLSNSARGVKAQDLRQLLAEWDGKPYRAYRRLEGSYELCPGLRLDIVRVQPDPFAPPSHLRIVAGPPFCELPPAWNEDRMAALGASDTLLRTFCERLDREGDIGLSIQGPGAEMRERTALQFFPDPRGIACILRLFAELPQTRGRRMAGRAAAELLLERLPAHIRSLLVAPDRADARIADAIRSVRLHHEIQDRLHSLGLVAFLAEGSVLPRRSGRDTRPLAVPPALPLEVPESLGREIRLASGESVRGLAIPEGLTVVVGGGFHGKTTLLEAIMRGVHPHPPGDGREGVVTDPTVVLIESEEGRSVARMDLGAFLDRAALPETVSADAFSTGNASGSTSEAAAVMEALEAGSRVLLFDEDTSAANFLVRDPRMRALVSDREEPIRPLLERVPALRRRGISLILAQGSSGAFFGQADTVVQMLGYRPVDVTARAHEVAGRIGDLGAGDGEGRSGTETERGSQVREGAIPTHLDVLDPAFPGSAPDHDSVSGLGPRWVDPQTWRTLQGVRSIRTRGPSSLELGRVGRPETSDALAQGVFHAETHVQMRSIPTVLEAGEVHAIASLIRTLARGYHVGSRSETPEALVASLRFRLSEEGLLAFEDELWDATVPRASEVWFALARWPGLGTRTEPPAGGGPGM